jgi:hypothetical protein
MKNTGKFSRMLFAFGLFLSLGVAPTLTVHAQQPAQKQSAPQAESPTAKTQPATEEKKQTAEADALPLSDAELEKVEGGFAFIPAAIIAGRILGPVAAGVAGNIIYNHFHKTTCTPTRRR